MKIIKEFINRIKILYLFWRLTKEIGHLERSFKNDKGKQGKLI